MNLKKESGMKHQPKQPPWLHAAATALAILVWFGVTGHGAPATAGNTVNPPQCAEVSR